MVRNGQKTVTTVKWDHLFSRGLQKFNSFFLMGRQQFHFYCSFLFQVSIQINWFSYGVCVCVYVCAHTHTHTHTQTHKENNFWAWIISLSEWMKQKPIFSAPSDNSVLMGHSGRLRTVTWVPALCFMAPTLSRCRAIDLLLIAQQLTWSVALLLSH